MKTTYTIETDEKEIELTVEYDYFRARRGSRDRYGFQYEPDEPAEIEITSVTLEDGTQYELTRQEDEEIEEFIWNEIEAARHFDDYDYND